ncbi:phosphopantetheine-binding protein, partial [Flavobacterium sp. T12S277]|uniref:phosphopantetheine-binding protein n=1 Tax=Flavobacterium sp. T12S277 TaxID=3402752 RepID=UPI003AEE7DAD
YTAPRTELERSICSIWEEVLGLDRVGVTDNFFRIGGNSILAIQVSHRMSKALKVDIKVADIFRLKFIIEILELLKQDFGLVKPYYEYYNYELDDIIFISPSSAGSEVYQNLAEMLSIKYNCIGIDNYNIHYKDKISSLNKLANYYLLEYEKKYTLKEPINLLGWSLGGQISLEIAVVLEGRGYKNINVTLLDSFLRDKTMQSLVNNNYRDEIIKKYKDFKMEESKKVHGEKIIAALDTENKLANSSIAHKLKYSNIVLFKAMLVNINNKNSKLFNEYCKTLDKNNINLISDNVQVVNLECYHGNILENNSLSISEFLIKNKINTLALDI